MFPKAKSLGLIVKDNMILLEEQKGKHSKGTGIFYRPIGGTIELGEISSETVIREYQEELEVKITIKSYISCLENIFNIDETIGHEIIQIYLVEFEDECLYQKQSFKVMEGSKITLSKWIPLQELFNEKKVLYPNGLSNLILDNMEMIV